MFHLLEKRIQQVFESHIAARYGVRTPVVVEQPKQAEFGELAVPVAFQLAKQLRQAPKKIAQELVSQIGPVEGIAARSRDEITTELSRADGPVATE